MKKTEEIFSGLGGKFLTPAADIHKKYASIKTLVFDWDGVFNNGLKFPETGSLFSEPDSMGVNLMRFNYFLTHKKLLRTYIVTGLNNTMAIEFANRENFDAIYLNFKFKQHAFDQICDDTNCTYDEIAFIFDDILDLGMAKKCNLSFFIRRKASPLTTQYVIENKICDYISASEGGEHAVREICELLLGLSGKFIETIENRIRFMGIYEEYLNTKVKISTKVITNKQRQS